MIDATALRNRLLGADPRFQRFVMLLGLATAVPMLAVPVTRFAYPHSDAMLGLAGLMTFLGGPGHVSLTSWFYADPVARDHFREHPLRYIWAPLALIVGTTLAYAIWQEREPTRWINLFFSIWLLWHYQRQNWGVHSFVSRVASGESASKLEEWILKIAVVGGIIGAVHSGSFGAGTAVANYSGLAFRIGGALTASLPVLIAVAVATVPGLRTSPLRLCTLLVASAFFLPVFVFSDSGTAVLPYGLAHGMQYLVFMSYVAGAATLGDGDAAAAATTKARSARPGIVTLIVGMIVVGFFLTVTGDVELLKRMSLLPLFGMAIGVTMAHFVVDAGIWRLREEFPRRYVGAAFPFLGLRSR